MALRPTITLEKIAGGFVWRLLVHDEHVWLCDRDVKEFDHEVTETHAARLGLDKASEAFRRIHVERQELIALWEQTIATMQARDAEIENTANAFQQLKSETNEKVHVRRHSLYEK